MQYLDSGALAKRYVQEDGSDAMDQIFERAEKGEGSVFFSTWNVGELAVVFDTYERDGLLEAKSVMIGVPQRSEEAGEGEVCRGCSDLGIVDC